MARWIDNFLYILAYIDMSTDIRLFRPARLDKAVGVVAVVPAVLFLSLLSASGAGLAQQANPTLRRDDLREKELREKSIIEEMRRQKEKRPPKKKTLVPKARPAEGRKWSINRISINRGGEEAGPVVDDIIAKYTGKRLGKIDFLEMVESLVNRYIGAGFSTTLMRLDFSEIENGQLTVRVAWGRVSKVLVNGRGPSSWRERCLVESALPGVVDRPLNMHDIDQAVDNLNNGILSAGVNIAPDARDGYSIVNITTQSKGYDLAVNSDNSGTGGDGSGKWKLSPALALNGPLGNGDSFGLSASGSYYSNRPNESYDTMGLSYSLPYGPFKLSLNGSANFYKSLLNGLNDTFYSDGGSLDITSRLNWVARRSATRKISLFGSLNYKDYKNYIENVRVQASSQKYGEFGIGGEWVGNVAHGVAYGDISLHYGVPVFGSRRGLLRGDRSERRSVRAIGNISWQRDFLLDDVKSSYRMRTGWQYASRPLSPNARFSVGDSYTIRGFSSDTGATGDAGLYLSNTLDFPGPMIGGNVSLTPFLGVDAGTIHNVEAGGKNVELAGAALGSRMTIGVFSGSVTLSRALFDSRNARREYELYVSTRLPF